jgi:hypothetical protein
MKLVRRHKRRRPAPPVPRNDVIGDRGEQLLFDEAFAQSIWRRGVPLL